MLAKNKLVILAILLIAVCGAVAVLITSRFGIGTSPDSVIYIGAARSLLSGAGLTVPFGNPPGAPLTQYPPFYPLVLALLAPLGIDPLTSARLLGALVFAGNILLVGAILLRLLPRQGWAAITGSILILLAPVMVGVHLMAWTEPLFILLGLSGMFVLGAHLEKPGIWQLLGAGLLVGLATLTRYAGLAYIATGGLGLLFFSRRKLARRLQEAVLFIAISFSPLLLVLGLNWLTAGTATNRSIGIHPPSRSQLWQGLTTLTGWVGIPNQMPTLLHLLLILAALAGILGLLYASRRGASPRQSVLNTGSFPGIIWLILLWMPIYGLFLLASVTFLDANTPFDDRILAPLYPALIILSVYAIATVISSSQRQQIWRWVAIGFALLFLIQAGLGTLPILNRTYHFGSGFSTPVWQESPLLAQIRSLPAETHIYSNAPEAVYFIAGKPAARLPRLFEVSAQQANQNFDRELAEIGEEMQAGQAVIVFFDQQGRQTNPSELDLNKRLPLLTSYQANDGRIFTFNNP